MSDYKELIADLRNPNKVFYETFLNEESKSVESVVAYKAANAIERLVSDYEILAKMYAKVNEELCVRTKERDAATDCIYAVQDSLYRVGGNDYAEGIIEQWEKEREDNT